MLLDFLENIGPDSESIMSNVFRSASAHIYAQHKANTRILECMNELLQKQEIVIETVLMKSFKLPDRLSSSIKQKLLAEHYFMRLEFILYQEKLTA